jgi:mRNA interferase RelE/StbE
MILNTKHKLLFSEKFINNFGKFSVEYQNLIIGKLHLLGNNPRHPSLRTQKLNKWDELIESSVSMDIRLIWQYDGDDIIIQDIGRHDILRKYN